MTDEVHMAEVFRVQPQWIIPAVMVDWMYVSQWVSSHSLVQYGICAPYALCHPVSQKFPRPTTLLKQLARSGRSRPRAGRHFWTVSTAHSDHRVTRTFLQRWRMGVENLCLEFVSTDLNIGKESRRGIEPRPSGFCLTSPTPYRAVGQAGSWHWLSSVLVSPHTLFTMDVHLLQVHAFLWLWSPTAQWFVLSTGPVAAVHSQWHWARGYHWRQVQCCFTSTDSKDGEPSTATSTFTKLCALSEWPAAGFEFSVALHLQRPQLWTIRGRGAQHVHLVFHWHSSWTPMLFSSSSVLLYVYRDHKDYQSGTRRPRTALRPPLT